jgi:hypothetical protein
MKLRAEKHREISESVDKDEAEETKSDWRPLVSYQMNLSRVGNYLLGADAASKTLRELQPLRRRRMDDSEQPLLYPWYWSAGVLTGLFVLSVCILSFSVRSLDRLR